MWPQYVWGLRVGYSTVNLYCRKLQITKFSFNRTSNNDMFPYEVVCVIVVSGRALVIDCVQSNASSGTIEGGEFFDYLSDFQLLKKDSVPWNWSDLLVTQGTEIILHTNCIQTTTNLFSSKNIRQRRRRSKRKADSNYLSIFKERCAQLLWKSVW
jgi:hypothetical protein